MCASGAPFAVRRSSAKLHWPTGALTTSAVTVIVCGAPGASVKRDGCTVTLTPRGPAVRAVHVALDVSVLSTVRVQLQVPLQFGFAMLAMLSALGFPAADAKFGTDSSST